MTAFDRAGVKTMELVKGVAALVEFRKSYVSVRSSLKNTRGVFTLLLMNLVVVEGGASGRLPDEVPINPGVTGGFEPPKAFLEKVSLNKVVSSLPQVEPIPGVSDLFA